jgi:hypothetical protein
MIRKNSAGESMKYVIGLWTGAVLLATTGLAQDQGQQAQPKRLEDTSSRTKMREARSFRRLKVSGEQVEKNVRKLTKELKWHKSLGSALAAGRREGKPVVWIQALGDLNGFL